MEPLLKVEKLRKYYNSNKVIDNVSFEAFKGEVLGIIGPSGSGKTTLLNTLIGFLEPDFGNIYFRKDNSFFDISKNMDYLKKHFGFAAQHPSFYERLTVFENLDYFGSLYNLSEEARLSNIKTILELVELKHAKNTIAKNLSGGMQRRLDIGCAIIHNPEVLILDEPTSDLDPVLSKHIWELTKKINKKGTTIIVASHDLGEVEYFCTRVAIIFQGKMPYIATVTELKHMLSKGQEIHIETYPGNYANIIKNFKNNLVSSMENRGNSLIIRTKKPDKILSKLLQTLEKLDESLLDLKISKLSLKEIFKAVTKDENKANNKKEH